MKYIVHRSQQGAAILRVPMPGIKSVTVLALVNTGRRYEPDHWAGISHFLEHMVFKGTKNFPQAKDVASAIDRVGGEFNAFTSKEYTGYYVKLASQHLDLAMNVVTDMLCVPMLRQEDIDRESGVIVEEINMYEDMPMRRIHDVFESQVFDGHKLAGRILGRKEVVTNLKSEDFQAYMQDWYGYPNVVFVVAGDEAVVGDDALVEKIEDLFEKGGTDRKANNPKDYWGASFSENRKQIVFKETEQAHFKMGFPTFSRYDDRRYALMVLTTLMGKTMSSRLFSEIREKRGLCYYVRAEDDYYHDVGMIAGSAGVDPNRLQEAITAMKTEFLSIHGERPIEVDEVEAAKQNAIGQLALQLEDSQSMAAWYGMKQLLRGEIETEEQVVERLRAVTRDEVQQLAEDVFREEALRFALIGPFEDVEV